MTRGRRIARSAAPKPRRPRDGGVTDGLLAVTSLSRAVSGDARVADVGALMWMIVAAGPAVRRDGDLPARRARDQVDGPLCGRRARAAHPRRQPRRSAPASPAGSRSTSAPAFNARSRDRPRLRAGDIVAGAAACLALPLMEGDGLVGVLALYREPRRPFSDDELGSSNCWHRDWPRRCSNPRSPKRTSTTPAQSAPRSRPCGWCPEPRRSPHRHATATSTNRHNRGSCDIIRGGCACASKASEGRSRGRCRAASAMAAIRRASRSLTSAPGRCCWSTPAPASVGVGPGMARADRADRPVADPLPLGPSAGPPVLRGVLPAWLGDVDLFTRPGGA